MAKIRYYFDTDLSQFKRVDITLWSKLRKIINLALFSFGLALAMVVAYHSHFEFPTESKLKQEVREMEVNYARLDHQVASLRDMMASIERRDDRIYRMVLGAEPMDPALRNGGVGGADRYLEIRNKGIDHSERIVQLYANVDKLRRKLYIESISQDELLQMATDKEKQYASIPAIQPISNRQLTALTSGFGLRLHPFYKVIVMHTGIDFAAPEGTPIYATADGEVEAADTIVQGYGKMITLSHGFGYQTRYAHLQAFAVKSGAHVKRGERIAFVGNTGMSTAPHLHYEVLLQGTQINPIHYFFNDLNPADYEKITQLASVQNQAMGN